MPDEAVLLRRQDRVVTLLLHRPRIMNAMNEALVQGLKDALDKASADPGIHVVVLEGAGGNFSSGADFSLLDTPQEAGFGAPEWLAGMERLGAVIRLLREMPQPVVAKVRGVAVGAGANLALAADFVVAAHEARFCQIFINIGLILDAGGTYFLPRLVGLAKARELAFLGDMVGGREAAAIGLIHCSVDEERLDEEVEALAGRLAGKSLSALGYIKRGLERSLDMSLPEMLDWEAAHQAVMLQTPEHKAIVRGYLNARRKKNSP